MAHATHNFFSEVLAEKLDESVVEHQASEEIVSEAGLELHFERAVLVLPFPFLEMPSPELLLPGRVDVFDATRLRSSQENEIGILYDWLGKLECQLGIGQHRDILLKRFELVFEVKQAQVYASG